MVSILGEDDDDRAAVISRLERRFGVTALPDHFAAFKSNPFPANLVHLLEQQVRDVDQKKQELAKASYRIMLQPCSPLQLIEFAERQGVIDLMETHKALLRRDISDELVLIAPDPSETGSKALFKKAEAHRPGHVFVTSDPEDETFLGEMEASLAQIGGWGIGY